MVMNGATEASWPVSGAAGAQPAAGGLWAAVAAGALRWAKFSVGLAALPACCAVGMALCGALGRDTGWASGGWAPAWRWFIGGAVLLAGVFAVVWRPVTMHVFAHEVGHAVLVWLCGGRVSRLSASASGGQVTATKSNMLVRLAPYCIPFYAVLAAGIFLGLNAWWRPLAQYHWLLAGVLGCTWAFHLLFTVWSLARGQSDLKADGRLFSLVLIFLANVLVFAAVAGLALSGHWRGAWEALEDVVLNGWHHCRTIYGGIFELARQALGHVW